MGRSLVLRGFAVAVLALGVLFWSGAGPMAASKSCNVVGAWMGVGQSEGRVIDFRWTELVSPGQSATVGGIEIDWAHMEPTFGGAYPSAVRVTPGLGTWEKGKKQTYTYTWIAYGVTASGNVDYIIRGSGTKTMTDCDHVNMTFVLEFFNPSQDITWEAPLWCLPGLATELRVGAVQATCP
jgi:hypothetical protein